MQFLFHAPRHKSMRRPWQIRQVPSLPKLMLLLIWVVYALKVWEGGLKA